MGYTRYWVRTDKPITEDFVEEVKEIIKDCAKKGIAIRGRYGEGSPIINTEEITFNGNFRAEKDLSHEPFSILNIETGFDFFDFCKTNRKPYDYAVRRVLKLAKDYGLVTNVSSDGKNNKIYSDEEYISDLVEW